MFNRIACSKLGRNMRGASTIEYVLAFSCVTLMLCPALGMVTERSNSVMLRLSAELNGNGSMAVAVSAGEGSPLLIGEGTLTDGRFSSPGFSQGGGSGTTIRIDESTSEDSEGGVRGESSPDSSGTSVPQSGERPRGAPSSIIGPSSPRQ